MPRYSVMIVASAAVSLAETSSTTATFSARGFSVVMYTSSRFNSWCSHCSEHREERGMVPDFRRVHLGWRDFSHSSTRHFWVRTSGLRRATYVVPKRLQGRGPQTSGRNRAGSTLIPGPMVDETEIFFR